MYHLENRTLIWYQMLTFHMAISDYAETEFFSVLIADYTSYLCTPPPPTHKTAPSWSQYLRNADFLKESGQKHLLICIYFPWHTVAILIKTPWGV